MDDKQTWRTIRKELEDIGISVVAFDSNKAFIMQWFKMALETGAFKEDLDRSEREDNSCDLAQVEEGSIGSNSDEQLFHRDSGTEEQVQDVFGDHLSHTSPSDTGSISEPEAQDIDRLWYGRIVSNSQKLAGLSTLSGGGIVPRLE